MSDITGKLRGRCALTSKIYTRLHFNLTSYFLLLVVAIVLSSWRIMAFPLNVMTDISGFTLVHNGAIITAQPLSRSRATTRALAMNRRLVYKRCAVFATPGSRQSANTASTFQPVPVVLSLRPAYRKLLLHLYIHQCPCPFKASLLSL